MKLSALLVVQNAIRHTQMRIDSSIWQHVIRTKIAPDTSPFVNLLVLKAKVKPFFRASLRNLCQHKVHLYRNRGRFTKNVFRSWNLGIRITQCWGKRNWMLKLRLRYIMYTDPSFKSNNVINKNYFHFLDEMLPQKKTKKSTKVMNFLFICQTNLFCLFLR